MTPAELRQYAQLGAEARLEELYRELDAIHRLFPALRSRRRRELSGTASSDGNGRGMSAAQRKAVSERMKAYWAKRRGDTSGQAKQALSVTRRRRTMSPEARKRIAEAQRKRWAEVKARKSASEPATTKTTQPVAAKAASQKKK